MRRALPFCGAFIATRSLTWPRGCAGLTKSAAFAGWSRKRRFTALYGAISRVRYTFPSTPRRGLPPPFPPAITSPFSRATLRFFVDDASKVRLASEQLTKIDNIQNEQGALPCRDDRGVPGTASEQRHFAEKLARTEDHRFGPHLHF